MAVFIVRKVCVDFYEIIKNGIFAVTQPQTKIDGNKNCLFQIDAHTEKRIAKRIGISEENLAYLFIPILERITTKNGARKERM